MFIPATLPTGLTTAIAALFLLFGVPAILFLLLMLYTGYVRRDAEQYLEQLEAEGELTDHEGGPEAIGGVEEGEPIGEAKADTNAGADDATRNADSETN